MAPLGAARAIITMGGDLGKLELIQTQTVSGVAAVNFTSIQGSSYKNHMLVFNNVTLASGNNQIGLRFYESGSIEDQAVYEWAIERIEGSSFSEQKTTGFSRLPFVWYALGTNTGANANGFCTFFNLHDSNKYSYYNTHSSGLGFGGSNGMQFGGGVMPQTSTVDGIQIAHYDASVNISGTFSLYGIAED